MTEARFVVNASPLIFLAAIDALLLLPQLVGQVLLPEAVLGEVLARKEPHPALQILSSTAWVRIEPDAPIPEEVAGWDLGAGETQVLALGRSRRGVELVLDDLQARRCARSLGLPTTGTLGVILRAKRRGFIPAAQAIPRLTADPQAAARLSVGQAVAYGQLHGRAETRFRPADLTRQAATSAVPALRNALDDYHEAGRAAVRAQGLANSISESLPKLRDQLHQLGRTIQRVEQAMKGPEKAIEALVREVGLQGARLALSALPRPFHLPVELAIRAVERVLDLGLGMGR